MVWGLVEPNTFSDFFLNGVYTAWEEKMNSVYEFEMSEEDKNFFRKNNISYTSYIVRKFTENLGSIASHEIPDEYKLVEKCKSPASMIKLGDRLLAVDGDLKNLIEEIEPGIHKFVPIKLIDYKGVEYNRSYFAIIIQSFLDAFVQDQSECFRGKDSIAFYHAIDNTKKTYSKICISKEATSNHHLWRDTKLFFPSIFISDEMQSKISKTDLRIFKHYKMKDQ